MKIYVGNLSFQSDEQALRDLFGQHGEVEEVAIITDRETGRSRGFAFVTMADDSQAKAAIEALHGQECEGRTITVNEARPKTERSRGGGGGGGSSGSGGGYRGRGERD